MFVVTAIPNWFTSSRLTALFKSIKFFSFNHGNTQWRSDYAPVPFVPQERAFVLHKRQKWYVVRTKPCGSSLSSVSALRGFSSIWDSWPSRWVRMSVEIDPSLLYGLYSSNDARDGVHYHCNRNSITVQSGRFKIFLRLWYLLVFTTNLSAAIVRICETNHS